MTSERRAVGRALAAAAVAVIVGACAAAPPAVVDTPTEGVEPGRLHADARELQRAFVEALDALLDEDTARAKQAFDRMPPASPPAVIELQKSLGETVVDADRAFQNLINLAREVSNKGDNEQALRYHQGLQRTCLQCHDYARKDGVFPRSLPEKEP